MKSLAELDRLVNDVILADDFQKDHLHGFRASREAKRLDNLEENPYTRFSTEDGWIESQVEIALPADEFPLDSENDAPRFTISGLFYRPLLEVIKAAFQETNTERFHFSPFREYWRPSPDAPPERIYSELYTSDAFLKEHEKIMSQPPEPDCILERVIAGIMLWSDSTHLTSFGNASLWPIYLYVGNLTKYIRGKPTSCSAHHLAYVPKVRYLFVSDSSTDTCSSCPTSFKTFMIKSLRKRPPRVS